jgi:hypothetical protein
MRKHLAAAAAAACLGLAAPLALSHELELEGSPACSVTDMAGATACAGAFDGNNVNVGLRPLVLDELADLSGLGGWHMVATYWTERAPTGTLNLLAPIDGAFAIALKSSTNFSLYYFNGVGPAIGSLAYSTIGTSVNRRGLPQDLSHATLYLTNAVPVPEPETYAMLLAGLAGIGFVLRRRQQR